MKRLRPRIGVGLAWWLACSAPVLAQGEFYIELRGPESAASAPPAAVPSSAPAQPVASPGRYGPVRSTDTLWGIAARHTQAPVTVQQTMIALYHLNPQAFVRGNINYLQRGARLRLPTQSQARQRSPGEAEAEFRRLSRQGNRTASRVATASKPAPKPVQTQTVAGPKPAAPAAVTVSPNGASAKAVQEAPPVAAVPPVQPATVPAVQPADSGASLLSEPKAAPAVPAVTAPPPASEPEQAEEMTLARLQLQLMDELREQVAMSNEQLAALADNNQALRQRLTRLTVEVEELKQLRQADAPAVPEQKEAGIGSWLDELLTNPLNLALVLTLPALLLLALFTLWWRNRVRRDLAEQEQELSESTSVMMAGERDEFDDLFSSTAEPESAGLAEAEPRFESDPQPEPEVSSPEPEIDEDAFARFLEEQQRLEEEEAQRRQVEEPTSETAASAASGDVDSSEMLFEDEMATDGHQEPRISNDDIDELLFNDASPATSDVPGQKAPPQSPPEPAPKQKAADADYVSVDQLMAEADLSEGMDRDYERKLDLDLELDEYADVLGQSQGVDIDVDEGGMGARLDLARAYIEIDDIDSARDLLNEALERGNEEQRRDAQKLLQRLAKR